VRVLELAPKWQGMLERREVRTQAELATRAGLCAVYVGNILGLLRLHPAILERIEKLGPGGLGVEVTERWLRRISKLPHDEQLAAVAERLPATEPEEVA
jgi:hypothetical protein